jgi:2-oxo-4-hydroxy-4-carboxy-5-ureidoimidazoline decarboxylase
LAVTENSVRTLAEINRLDCRPFVEALGQVFELAPWVAERAWPSRPFSSVRGLHAAMMAQIHAADPAARLALLHGHPELAGSEAVAGSMTAESTSEQARLGLVALTPAQHARMQDLNRRYRERHGFPCIIALSLHRDLGSVFAEFEKRLASPEAGEEAVALAQVSHISGARLRRLVTED